MMKLASHLTHVGALLIICLNFAGVQPARAQTKDFNLPAQPAIKGIPEFARQAGVQMLVSEKLVRGKQTAAVTGRHSIEEAVGILLQGTGLTATTKDGGTYTVVLAPPPKTGNEPIQFDIPNEDLAMALNDFSTQSGLTVGATKELTAGKKSKGVRGTMSAAEALRRLLKGSGLTFVTGADGNFAVQASASEGPSQEKDTADVTVESQQEKEKPYSGMNVDIPRTINDVQPYYIFDSQTIEQSGAVNLEDFLKQRLTMDTSVQTSSQKYNTSTTGNGPVSLGTSSSINLRGLGTNETLILIDGRRRAGVSITAGGAGNQPDINGIPISAVDRIEVLPSSASGIYGGSALGGVINIILKKNYNGGEVRLSEDNTFKGHAPIRTADGTWGFSLEHGRTQVMITGHYSDAKPLQEGDRPDVIGRGIQTILKNNPGYFQAGVAVFPGGTTNIHGLDAGFNPAPLVLKNGTSLNSPFTHISPGANSTTDLNAELIANAGSYNFSQPPGTGLYGLQQDLGSSATDRSVLLTVRRQMTSWLDAFAEFSYTSNTGRTVDNPLSEGATFLVKNTWPISPFQNPFIALSFPSNVDARQTAVSNLEAITTGVTAHLAYGWTGELDYTWSKSILDSDNSWLDTSGLGAALKAGTVNPFLDTIANPLNLQPYLNPNNYNSSATLNDVALRASGPIFKLPWGSPILTLGLEHRKEGYPASVEAIIRPSNPANNGFDYFLGQSESTNSIYAEANIPLIAETNAVPGARSLELQIADRLERYSVDAGTAAVHVNKHGTFYSPSLDAAGHVPVPRYIASYSANTRTFGLKYKPIDDVTLRVSNATAFLPPTYAQLLPNAMVNIGGDFVLDPKTGSSYPVNTIGGGNPNLKPQNSKSWDAGIIYQPTEGSLKGLRVDLEFYQINQFGYITSLTGNQILNVPSLAGRVTRDPTTGLITQIDESLLNATEFKTEGWDLSFDYRKPTSIGTFDVYAGATMIEHDQRQLTSDTPFAEYVGFPGAGGETKIKANATLTWANKGWTAGWTVTWFDHYSQVDAPGGPFGGGGGLGYSQSQGGFSIPSQTYHQVFAGYAFGKDAGSILSNVTVQLGIKDLFNTAPRFDAYFAPFFYSPYGDIRMREFWLTLRKGW